MAKYNTKTTKTGTNNWTFFTNSDDEAVGFWESWNTPMLDQISMIQHMQTLINKKSDVNFIVKIHPNLVNKPFHVQKRWEKLKNN